MCPYPCVVTGSPGRDVCGVSEHQGLTVRNEVPGIEVIIRGNLNQLIV